MSRRLITIVFTILIGVVVLVGGLMLFKKDDSTIKVQDKPVSDNRLTITNLDQYSNGISSDQQYDIEKSIYKMIGRNGGLSGIVREGSYKKYMQDGYTNVVFLVDLPSIKRTYRATLTIAELDGYRAVNILCPDEADLIYPAFECKDIRDA